MAVMMSSRETRDGVVLVLPEVGGAEDGGGGGISVGSGAGAGLGAGMGSGVGAGGRMTDGGDAGRLVAG